MPEMDDFSVTVSADADFSDLAESLREVGNAFHEAAYQIENAGESTTEDDDSTEDVSPTTLGSMSGAYGDIHASIGNDECNHDWWFEMTHSDEWTGTCGKCGETRERTH